MVALFLLSQVFLIVSHGPLVHTLAVVMLMSDLDTIQTGTNKVLERFGDIVSHKCVSFSPPKETLEKSLETLSEMTLSTSEEHCDEESHAENTGEIVENANDESQECHYPSTSFDVLRANASAFTNKELDSTSIPSEDDLEDIKQLNVTDEEKQQRLAMETPLTPHQSQSDMIESLAERPFLETIINSLLCAENDYTALFALCLLYALVNNQVTVRNS